MSARPQSVVARFVAWLEQPRLGLVLALIAAALAAPSLAIGFHLDDYVHRYMLSDRPGAAELLHAYESPFGIANGDPATNHWQIEQGYAPWWTYPQLLVSLWRPLSEATHRLDAALFPDSAVLQHAHSLLWLFVLIWAATSLYRSVYGATTIAGVAAVMYAFDHTHGFATGWIANRNALVAAALGVLAFDAYVRARTQRSSARLALSLVLLGAALLSGEGAAAVVVYILGYALFVEHGPLSRRLLPLVPHVVLVIGWRVVYTAIGRGARYCGLYLDPVREPLEFARAIVERVPFLGLGQLALPPAEAAVFGPRDLYWPMYAGAAVVCAIALYAFWPLLRADGRARCFAFGAAASLVVACTTHPNNRLLFFSGIGLMPLLSQIWHGALQNADFLPARAFHRRVLHVFAAIAVGFRLFVSPLLLPLTACSVVLSAPIGAAARDALAAARGRELVVVSSPDFFYVKLIPVFAALSGPPPPERLRALSFGAIPLRVTRSDAHTLDVEFEGGILDAPLRELYRSRALPMPVGTKVQLEGLAIEVTAVTPDQRAAGARFRFEAPLEDPRYVFLRWGGQRYLPFAPPPVGGEVALPAAELHLGL